MKARFFFFFLLAVAGCSAENSVVGGHCRAGFTESNGACISLVDPNAAGSSDANRFGDGTASAPPVDVPTSNGGSSSGSVGGSSGGPLGEGTVGTTSSAVVFGEVEVPAALECQAPLVACRGACIPVASDGDNCGACGKICPSNICIDGECQGALAGDVIVLGHEYASSWSSSAQAKMLANAVSIPTTDPIRVVSFDGGHPGAATERALVASTIRFRGVAYDNADDAALEATDLARHYDVVLLHGAGSAPGARGASWSSALETFTKKGGVVIALDDGSSDMPALLRASGLLAIDGHTSLASGMQVVITAPNDAVGVQILSPYAPTGASVGFFGVSTASDVTIVARSNDVLSLPTAIHRFVKADR